MHAKQRRTYPSPDAARDHLIDAGLAYIERDGLGSFGISSVAKEAGVSRPTVYRYFTDREDLVHATLLKAGDQFAARGAAHVSRFDSPAEMAIEGVIFGAEALPRHPVFGRVFGRGQIETLALVSMRRAEGLAVARRAWSPLVRATRWDERTADECIRVLHQFELALVLTPEPDATEEQTRGYLERRLLPAIGLTPR
jgi:AcrR family transcriptional regulator